MKSKQSRGLQAFRRATAWFAAHPDVIPNSGSSAKALQNQLDALNGVVERMTAQATQQTTQAQQALLVAHDEVEQRKALRNPHMSSIVQVARALHGTVPGIGILQMPDAQATSEQLVRAAQSMQTTAAIYKDVLVEHGLPEDFLEQLASSTTTLRQSIDARGVAQSSRHQATTQLESDLKLGRRIVGIIDGSLTHVLKDQQAVLSSWKQAKRITIKGVAVQEQQQPPTPAAPAGGAAPVQTPATQAA